MTTFSPYGVLPTAAGSIFPIMVVGLPAVGLAQGVLGLDSPVPTLITALLGLYATYTGIRVRLYGAEFLRFKWDAFFRMTLIDLGLCLVGAVMAALAFVVLDAMLPTDLSRVFFGPEFTEDGLRVVPFSASLAVYALVSTALLIPYGLFGTKLAKAVDEEHGRKPGATDVPASAGRADDIGRIFRQLLFGAGPFLALSIGAVLWQDHALVQKYRALPEVSADMSTAEAWYFIHTAFATANDSPGGYILGSVLLAFASMLTWIMVGIILAEAYKVSKGSDPKPDAEPL